MKPMLRSTVKIGYPQYAIYKYGFSDYNDNANDFVWTRMWNIYQPTILALTKSYARFNIAKVKLIFQGFRLREYWYTKLLEPGKMRKDGSLSGWTDHRLPKGDYKSPQEFKRMYMEENNGDIPDISDVGVTDGSRYLAFWVNNTGVESELNLAPNKHEHAKKYLIRRGLKIKYNLYCKPHQYQEIGNGNTALPEALTIIKNTDCPNSVIQHQIFVGPQLNGAEPAALTTKHQIMKVLSYNVIAYITCNFVGRRPDM